ncbi:hypothetical protein HHI36_023927, partial [Cryptolaemus montrouzieri]
MVFERLYISFTQSAHVRSVGWIVVPIYTMYARYSLNSELVEFDLWSEYIFAGIPRRAINLSNAAWHAS